MKPLLQIKDLHVQFQEARQEIHAVRGIDFFVREGEALGIVGESGSGKSAAVKSLLKLLPPHASTFAGEIRYNDQNIATYSEKQLQSIRGKEMAIIFQQSQLLLNPTQRVGRQILEALFCHSKTLTLKAGKLIVLQLLKEVGFSNPGNLMEAYPHELSGGMHQRVAIALALSCEPKILLADEPTSSLDAPLENQILSLLKHQQLKKKMSIVLITHDLKIASQFCERLLVMYAGKIVESGPVEEILHRSQHPYTQKLIQAMPRPDHQKTVRLVTIEGAPPRLQVPFDHCGFCSRCPYAMNICAEASPPLYQISEHHWSACFKHDHRSNLPHSGHGS